MTDEHEHGSRTPAQRIGGAAEDAVAAGLADQGWTILARNIRVGRGELDIVAVDPGPPPFLVIVEVRWRRSRAFGLAEETVDHRKRAHLRSSLGRLVEEGLPNGVALPLVPIRVDLVVVEPALRRGGPFRIRHHRAISL